MFIFKMSLVEKIAEWDNLLQAFYNAARGKWDWPAVADFYVNLQDNLRRMQKDIMNGTYQIERYKCKFVQEKKKRLIMALPFYDRVVQWAIYRQMYKWFDNKMYYHSYGSRVNKGTLKAVTTLQSWMSIEYRKDRECRYLKLDVSKFFYRIDHKVLLRILGRYFKNDQRMMKLLESIINSSRYAFGLPRFKSIDEVDRNEMLYDVGMPVGNLLSQLFANIYLNELDQYCKHVLHIKKMIRFMDDIVILHRSIEKIKLYYEKIKEFLQKRLHLDLNAKTCIGKIKAGITFLGRRVFYNKVKIEKRASKRMKKRMMSACMKYANYEITFRQAQSTLNSYYGEMKYVECQGLNKWISRYIVMQRNRDPCLFKQPVRRKNVQ